MNLIDLVKNGQKLWELLNTATTIFLIHNYIAGSKSYETGFPADGFIASTPKMPNIFTEGYKLYFHSDEELVYWALDLAGSPQISNLYCDHKKIEFLPSVKFIVDITEKSLDENFSVLVSEQQVRESFLKEKFEKALDYTMEGKAERLALFAK